jgi:hypothetical protein
MKVIRFVTLGSIADNYRKSAGCPNSEERRLISGIEG